MKKRKTMKSFRDSSSNAKSKNNKELTNNNKSNVIYNNYSDKAKETMLMQELTKEEHKRL